MKRCETVITLEERERERERERSKTYNICTYISEDLQYNILKIWEENDSKNRDIVDTQKILRSRVEEEAGEREGIEIETGQLHEKSTNHVEDIQSRVVHGSKKFENVENCGRSLGRRVRDFGYDVSEGML